MSQPASPSSTNGELDPDLGPLADDTARMAQRVVASYSTDAEECQMFIDMLGIGPEPVETE